MSYFGIPLRNGLPIGLGSVAALGTNTLAPFNPASLFANGEQGWIYNPSNFSTLFQDSAGTTPVTAVEQPVGLQLDLSQNLALGADLILNATNWLNPTNGIAEYWRKDGSLDAIGSIVDGTANGFSGNVQRYENGVGGTYRSFAINQSLAIGSVGTTSYYLLSFKYRSNYVVSSAYGGGFGMSVPINTGSAKEFRVLWTFSGVDNINRIRFIVGAYQSDGFLEIDDISYQELPGNHRFQATSGNRPVVSARVNLLTKTEEFDNATWTKNNSTITANTTIAPDGTTTADTMRCVAFGADCWVNQSASPSGVAYTGSCRFKYIDNAWVAFSNSGYFAFFNIQTGTLGTVGNGSATITDVGNGWYQCTWNQTDTTQTGPLRIRMAGANGSATTTPANASVFIWGADARPTNQGVGLPDYQYVNTSTDYTSTGFPIYIKPNGSNQFMQTNSINFTATDKMTVWQGVRKLSDAATALPIELSINAPANNGSFFIAAPVSASANYQFTNKGTIVQSASYTNALVAAPITNVLTSIGDISGDVATLRVNAAQVATSSADQGTGNYGDYPAYFYARAGTSLYFNGNDYASIARGAASTETQITDGETWVNNLTKAY
jgi:hypothetical protein